MWKRHNRSLSWVFVTRMISIICFLIIVVAAKILENFTTPGGIYQRAAEGILFANFWLFLLIAIILLVADLFMAIPFPLNLPGPIIRAFGSVFCVAFILKVFEWVDLQTGTSLSQSVLFLSFLIIPLIFCIVLISGYFEIMRDLFRPPKSDGDGVVVVHPDHPKAADPALPDAKSWDDIGAEFRLTLYDILHRLRQDVRRKP